MSIKLPYIDLILDLIDDDITDYKNAFGQNIHWGYWDNPKLSFINSKEFGLATERLNEVFLSMAEIKDGETVVDVGCGFGGTIQTLDKIHRDLSIYGINIDERQLERARNNNNTQTNNRIEFISADAYTLPFGKGSVDKVLALESIFHLNDREQFFREVKRVLKPGGKLIFTDFIPIQLLQPVTKVISENSSLSSFFGSINANCSEYDYQQIADKIGFISEGKVDITSNTLPTYSFLFAIGKDLIFRVPEAFIPTFLLFNFSALKIIRYMIFSYISI